MSSPTQNVDSASAVADVSPAQGGGLSSRFWALFGAVACSGIGDGMVVAAFPLLAAHLTSDPRLVAGVAVAATIPNLAALHLGALVDRADRRRLAATMELARAVLLVVFALLVAAADPPILAVYLVVFVIGLGATITETTAQTVLPHLVGSDDLAKANGLLLTAETASQHMLGQALGGVLFAAAATLPFLFDGISFVFSALLILVAIPASLDLPAPSQARVSAAVKDGWRHFRADPLLGALAGTIVTFAFCQAMVFGPLVLYATGPLGLGDAGFGLLLAVSSVGSMIGALLAGRIDARLRPDRILVLAGVVIAGGYLLAGAVTSVWWAGLGLFAEAFWVAVGNVASVSLRQRLVPGHLLGRVMGIFRFFVVGAFPLGALVGGVLASWVELRTPILVASGLQLLGISLLARPLHRVLARRPAPAV